MLDILKSISSRHLRILNVEYPFVFKRPIAIVPTSFPSLIELRISGPLREVCFTQSVTAPALERLYIRHYIVAPKCLGTELRRICPRLRLLRVRTSEERPQTDPLLQLLHAYSTLQIPLSDVIDMPPQHIPVTPNSIPDDESKDTPPFIPDSLQRIVVEFSAMYVMRGMMCGNSFMSHASHIAAYRQIAYLAKQLCGVDDVQDEECEMRKTLLICPPPPNVYQEHVMDLRKAELAKARQEWLESSMGSGRGCWI